MASLIHKKIESQGPTTSNGRKTTIPWINKAHLLSNRPVGFFFADTEKRLVMVNKALLRGNILRKGRLVLDQTTQYLYLSRGTAEIGVEFEKPFYFPLRFHRLKTGAGYGIFAKAQTTGDKRLLIKASLTDGTPVNSVGLQ